MVKFLEKHKFSVIPHRSLFNIHFIHILVLLLMQASGRIYLVLEYCRGGDLSMYIQRHGRVPEVTAKHFMQQLGTIKLFFLNV